MGQVNVESGLTWNCAFRRNDFTFPCQKTSVCNGHFLHPHSITGHSHVLWPTFCLTCPEWFRSRVRISNQQLPGVCLFINFLPKAQAFWTGSSLDPNGSLRISILATWRDQNETKTKGSMFHWPLFSHSDLSSIKFIHKIAFRSNLHTFSFRIRIAQTL